MNERFTRREFLQTLAVVTASAAALPLLDEPARAASGTAVGDVRQFRSNEWKAVTLSGGGTAFVRRRPGPTPRFQALSAACTHKGCPVAWRLGEKHFVCPCHGGKFDANGRNVGGPPPVPLKSLPVSVVKGVVRVGG